MTPPDQLQEEPLKNADLEGKIVGLRMVLTPEEGAEARGKFLEALRTSPLAVPTMTPVPTGPDGSVVPGAEINLLVVTTQEGVSGVPAFTTLGQLRAALAQVENGMFLTGGDLGNILGGSGHKLFVDSPDGHVEVESEELQQMAFITQQQVAIDQQRAQHNESLEEALAALAGNDSEATRADVVRAFLGGFCRYPLLTDAEGDAECLMLAEQSPAPGVPTPEIAVLTQDGALLAFTGEDAMRAWDPAPSERSAVILPGQGIGEWATQAEVRTILVNPGSPNTRALQVTDGQFSVA